MRSRLSYHPPHALPATYWVQPSHCCSLALHHRRCLLISVTQVTHTHSAHICSSARSAPPPHNAETASCPHKKVHVHLHTLASALEHTKTHSKASEHMPFRYTPSPIHHHSTTQDLKHIYGIQASNTKYTLGATKSMALGGEGWVLCFVNGLQKGKLRRQCSTPHINLAKERKTPRA
jgi:hypothetical protein